MTDLETRVREGLGSDPAWRSPDDLLDGVRRGARRRRARRTTGVVAAAALVLASVGGGVVWHHRQLQAAHATRALLPVGVASVSVTGNGDVFKAVSNQGCTSPCSTIWKYAGGTWQRLATIAGSGHSPVTDRAIGRFVMAPDGRNGWAWGNAFYSTHDGGHTWSEVRAFPFQANTQIDFEVGQTEAWVTSDTDAHGRTLWHSPVGSDDWTEARPPTVLAKPGEHMLATDWDIDLVLPDGRVALYAGWYPGRTWDYVGDGRGWTRSPNTCTPIPPLLGGRVQNHKICGPTAEYLGRAGYYVPLKYSEVQVAVHPGTPSAPVGAADYLYATGTRAVVATPSGIVPSDLRLGEDDQVIDSSESGDHVAIYTRGQRIFLSNDDGRHWTQVK